MNASRNTIRTGNGQMRLVVAAGLVLAALVATTGCGLFHAGQLRWTDRFRPDQQHGLDRSTPLRTGAGWAWGLRTCGAGAVWPIRTTPAVWGCR